MVAVAAAHLALHFFPVSVVLLDLASLAAESAVD